MQQAARKNDCGEGVWLWMLVVVREREKGSRCSWLASSASCRSRMETARPIGALALVGLAAFFETPETTHAVRLQSHRGA